MLEKTLILHCGDYKCGSSSIQGAFSENYDVLRKHGVNYTSVYRDGRAAHAGLVEQLISIKKKESMQVSGVNALMEDMKASACDVTMISSEALQDYLDELPIFLNGLAEGVRVKVLYFARPHASVIVSRYLQRAKFGRPVGSIEDFIQSVKRHRNFMYHEKYTRLSALLGAGNVFVRPFSRDHLLGGDVLIDALSVISGLGKDLNPGDILSSFSGEWDENISPGHTTVSIMQAIGRGLLSRGYADWSRSSQVMISMNAMVGILEKELGDSGDGKRIGIPDHLVASVISEYADDAARMDELLNTDLYVKSLGNIRSGCDFDPDLSNLFSGAALCAVRAMVESQVEALARLKKHTQ